MVVWSASAEGVREYMYTYMGKRCTFIVHYALKDTASVRTLTPLIYGLASDMTCSYVML